MFGSTQVIRTPLAKGGFILSSATPLGHYPDRITDRLAHWASSDPERHFLAQRRASNSWEVITYGEMFHKVRAIGQYLIDSGCGPDRPVASIADNSIEMACFALGAMYAGVPFAPISPTYASTPATHGKLADCLALLKPHRVYIDNPDWIKSIIQHTLPSDSSIISNTPDRQHASLSGACNTPVRDIDTINRQTGPDTVVKYLFTSGSTGTPKAVINTNRMLCANQKQFELTYPFVKQTPPILVDWLPWSHTFGGNEIFFLTMTQGGTLYIDHGKPMEQFIDKTIANILSVSPTIYFNVPAGFELLLAHMMRDTGLRKAFFSRLQMLFYAGAGMPQRVWTGLESLATETTGRQVAVVTAWGATETAPLATGVNFESHRSDNIGLPVPGCEIKFAPVGGRHELRVRGPNVMPGYLNQEEQTRAAFDTDGFYKTGDSAELANKLNPEEGIIFGGRLSEDFKLQTGTWVSVGRLVGLLAGELAPLINGIVIVGPDKKYLSALLFLNPDTARSWTDKPDATLKELAAHPSILAEVQKALDRHNANFNRSSMQIREFLVMTTPPDPEQQEITEKGSINQAAVLRNRAALIEKLYPPDAPH